MYTMISPTIFHQNSRFDTIVFVLIIPFHTVRSTCTSSNSLRSIDPVWININRSRQIYVNYIPRRDKDTVYNTLMTLSTYFTNQVSDSMDFIEFTNDAVIMVAEETWELCGKRLKLLLPCSAFCGLFTFSLMLEYCTREEEVPSWWCLGRERSMRGEKWYDDSSGQDQNFICWTFDRKTRSR